MNIQECKQIGIAGFLADLGYQPVRQRGNSLWYLSPLRNERTPSFKVDTNKNVWYDFGIGQGGDIIRLAGQLLQLGSVSDVLRYFSNGHTTCPRNIPYNHPVATPRQPQPETPMFEDLAVFDLTNEPLLQYMTNRGINRDIATAYCKEAHYSHKGKQYFAIAFSNRTGGYELRNPYFKGSVSPKDISAVAGTDRKTCSVFEGFMDCLSYLSMQDKANGLSNFTDCLVLNSVSNVKLSFPFLKRYPHVNLYLDNDKAGRDATAAFISRFEKSKTTKVEDCAGIFAPHNDFNDWWCKK